MKTRTKICPTCLQAFTYAVGKGLDRKHCSTDCRVKHQTALAKKRYQSRPFCSVPDCSNHAGRVHAGLCEKHYYRLRRTGSVEDRPRVSRAIDPRGYIRMVDRKHPLADSNGYVYEHRRVLFESLGAGDQPCFWCGTMLTWNNIVADHLNEDKSDNRVENLLVSCNPCNRARGAMLDFLTRMTDEAFPVFIEAIASYRGKRCHDRKTATQDGGFGRERGDALSH